MNELELALTQAVAANPSDDVVRLVLADWYEENGQVERAEFIRVQIAVYRHPGRLLNPDASYGEYARLVERERELWDNSVGIPLAQIAPLPLVGLAIDSDPIEGIRQISVRRGFIHTVRCTLADWMKHGRAIVATNPIERVELSDREPADVPEKIWKHLIKPNGTTRFTSRELAINALSDALIAWAKL